MGSLSVKFPHLDFTDRLDFDRSNGTVRRHEIYVTGSYGRSSLQVSYIQLPQTVSRLGLPSREQINAQADINFYAELAGLRRRRARPGQPASCSIPNMAWAMKMNAWRFRWPTGANTPSTTDPGRAALHLGDSALFPENRGPAGPAFQPVPQDVFALTHP